MSWRAEILVAGDADRVDHVPLAQLDGIDRGQVLGIGLHRLMGDLYVEVAVALKVVAQVLGAFVEQVLIHRTLLVDGHQFLHLAPADFCAFHLHLYQRALVGEKGIVQPIHGRHVLFRSKTDGCRQPLSLVVVLAQLTEGAADGIAIDLGVSLEFTLLAELRFGQAAVSVQLDVADPGGIARGNLKVEVDQRVGPVDDRGLGDLSPIKTIVLERRVDLRLRLRRFVFGIGRSRLELGGTLQHGSEAVVLHSVDVDSADKEARDPGEDDGDVVPGTHPGYLDGVVETGGIEAAQAVANLGRIQGRARLLRKLTGQRRQQSFVNSLEGNAAPPADRPSPAADPAGSPAARGEWQPGLTAAAWARERRGGKRSTDTQRKRAVQR